MIQPPFESDFCSYCPFPWVGLLPTLLPPSLLLLSLEEVQLLSSPAPSCFTAHLCPPHFLSTCIPLSSPISGDLVSTALSTAVSISSLTYCVSCSSHPFSPLNPDVFFLYFIVIVHLPCELYFCFSCPRVVGITRWICCQYLHRTQILAVYFLGSQDESIIINFSWNIELPVFSASKN